MSLSSFLHKRGLRSYHYAIVTFMLIAATSLLMWLGYRATREWQRSTQLLVQERTSEVVTLTILAISRDMRGMQSQVLPHLESLAVQSRSLYDLADEVGVAFGRYPYPESFFSWTADETGGGSFYVFNRTDRPPPWDQHVADTVGFPTTILEEPDEIASLIDLLRAEATMSTRFVLFETRIAGHAYQVVARLRYGGPAGTTLAGLSGFTVNMDWVRSHYFSDLASELSNIVSTQNEIVLSILDENGVVVTSNGDIHSVRSDPPLPVSEQRFPLFFFDPVLRATVPEGALPLRYWTARAEAVEGPAGLVAASGSRRMFMLISVTAVVAGIGLTLTGRAVRASAVLATMKSEFISAVTHDLKAPLSSIRLASETLARGRLRSPSATSEYAAILLNEVSRLNRTVNNLLAVARVQDVDGFYMFESIDLATVLEEVLSRFQTQFSEKGFEVHVDVPDSLPPIRADQNALLHVLDNLLDNAVRYSGDDRYLSISASETGDRVLLRITDRGRGIPTDEMPKIFDKFFRGRDVPSGGSGLGLAIAQRIIEDHGGQIQLHSRPGQGTTAEISLPLGNKDPNR